MSFNQQSAIPNQQSPLVLWRDGRAYVPARIADNPAVDEAEYRATLAHLPPVERARLMEGDWNVNAAGLVRPHWLRYFEEVGSALVFVDKLGIAGGQGSRGAEEKDPPTTAPTLRLSPAPPHPCSPAVFPAACRRFVTVDPAGTSSERAAESRGRPASWSVVQVWDQPLGELREHLLLRHVARARVGFDGLVRLLREVHAQWRPARMLIENEKLGQAAVDVLGRELPLVTIGTQGRDKVARAAPLLVKLEQGRLWLPRSAPWLADFENELLSWTGLPEETADQIDAAAYAVREAEEYWGEGRIERVFGA